MLFTVSSRRRIQFARIKKDDGKIYLRNRNHPTLFVATLGPSKPTWGCYQIYDKKIINMGALANRLKFPRKHYKNISYLSKAIKALS